MAPVAMILGGISGTISALFGCLLFGLGFWGAVQVYFCVALFVAAALILLTILRTPTPVRTKPEGTVEVAKPADMQRA